MQIGIIFQKAKPPEARTLHVRSFITIMIALPIIDIMSEEHQGDLPADQVEIPAAPVWIMSAKMVMVQRNMRIESQAVQ